MLEHLLQILSRVGEDESPGIVTQITAGNIITSYLESLGYTATELAFDLRLEAEVVAKLTSWSLGLENDPHSIEAARCCAGVANVCQILSTRTF